jgi:hypothetical protein
MSPPDSLGRLLGSAEEQDRLDPRVGSGSPETAPWELPPAPPWLKRQPLIAFALLVVLTDLGAALTTIAADQHNPLVLSVLGGLGVLVGVGALIVRQAVTPVAEPKLDRETPLVPASDDTTSTLQG